MALLGRRRAQQAARQAVAQYEPWRHDFDEARRLRIAGEHGRCLEKLLAIHGALLPDASDERQGISVTLEQARYGGGQPAVEILDRLERGVRREIERLEGELAQQERDRVLGLEKPIPASQGAGGSRPAS
jgi:hypothetical protein